MSRRDEHVNEDLLAYLDDELTAASRARVEAHLEACDVCARELAMLKELQTGLSVTIPEALDRLTLPATAETRIRRQLRDTQEREGGPWWARWWRLVDIGWEFWGRRVALTYVTLAVLVAIFGLNTWRDSRIAETSDQQETLVLAREQFTPGSQAALRVLVRDVHDTTPVPSAEVRVSIASRAPGRAKEVVFVGQTDAFGTTDVLFSVPADVEGQAELIIETRSEKGEDEITRPIQIVRSYTLLLSSDKPVYQPGQTIHMRALALGVIDRRPAEGTEIIFNVISPNGDRLVRRAVTASEYGIAGLEFPLDSQAPHGAYTLQASLGDTVSERTVNVQPYSLPKFQVTLETARSFYQPGDRVEGTVRADYFFGKPVVGGQVTLRGYVYDPEPRQVIELYGETDQLGHFEFGFDLPDRIAAAGPDADMAQVGLTVEVVDEAEHREAISSLLPVSQELILIDAVAESGLLKPGVENVVFLLTSYPDGRPAQTTLTVEVNGRRTELQTGPFGLAEYRFIPTREGATLRVLARDAAGAESQTILTLDADTSARSLLLRSERAAYRIGETLRLEALVADEQERVVYMDVIKAGQTILSTDAPLEDGRAVFALDLDERFFGTLELHAYRVLADGDIVRDTRVVVVDAPREIAIAVASDRDSYRPGETAELEIRTSETRELGGPVSQQPIQTALGIGIVDESVFAIEEQTPGFARMYFLLQKELLEPTYEVHGFELPSLLEADAESPLRDAQDLSARAAWAAAPTSKPEKLTRSYADKLSALLARELDALRGLGSWLVRALMALPLLLVIVAVWGLQPTGALKQALKRVGKGLGLLILTSPVTVPITGAALWLLWELLSTAALVLTLLAWLVSWSALTFYAWRASDRRAQIAGGLVAAYVVLGGLMAFVAAHDGDPTRAELIGVSLAYLLALLSLITLGQGLVIEGARRAGWSLTALGLLLVPITIFTASVPEVSSEFASALGSPAVYTLPGSLLTGCAGEKEVEVTRVAAEQQTVVEEKTVVEAVVEEETVVEVAETVVEKETVVEVAPAPTQAAFPTSQPPVATATPAPAASAVAPTAEPAAPTLPAEPPRLRQFFPETLYWAAEAITDESGYLAVDVPLADSITTWRLTALASSQAGQLGATTYGIRVFQPLFVDLDLPPSLTQGDEVRVPVAVFNYLSESQTVRLELSGDDLITLVDPESARTQTLTIGANDIEVVFFGIRADGHGVGRLMVTAVGDGASDAIVREIRVEPNGTEVRESLSDRLGDGTEIALELPDAAIPGTGRVEVRLYAGHIAQLLQGLTSMLQRPTGCFEQTSSANYPNVLILQAASAQSPALGLRPEVRLQAEHYVATGYQRLLTYEVPGGGFSLFGDAPAGLMLTAYGLMEFSDMARVYPVDPQVIKRTAEWLLSQQAGDGAWDPRALGYSHHESWAALADSRLPTTAYVTWALVQAGYGDDPRLQFALNYLTRNLDKAEDAYVLALVANALAAAPSQDSAAREAVDRLGLQAQVDGDVAHWQSRTESFSGAVGASAGLETTALAIYALLQDGRYGDLADQGLLYLIREQDDRGGWGTTQATVLALKAFNLVAELQGPEPVEATVGVYLDGQLAREVTITSENTDVVHTLYLDGVEAGGHRLQLDVAGDGSALLYQAVLAYYMPWEQAPAPSGDRLMSLEITYDRTALQVDETMVANVRLSLDQPGTAQWVLVELGLPPGFDVVTEDLEALIAQSAGQKTHIKRYEIAGRSLRLYLENLTAAVRFNFRLRARLAVRAQTGGATAYDYYNPTARDVQPPTMVMVAP